MSRKPFRLTLAALGALVAAASLALGNPGTSVAADSYHQHLWRYVSPGQIVQCMDNSWAGVSSSISMYWPDFVTAPVDAQHRQEVHLIAELQYWNGSAFVSVRDQRGSIVYTPWYYMLANLNGPTVQWWFEYGTNRYAPNRLSLDVVHGYAYRLKVWYHWPDGTWESDLTNWCYA